MNFRTRRRPQDDIDINVTSLIDVVLLLLIFFMVSTRFVDESKIDLQLPSATEHPQGVEPDVIDVVIDKHGRYFVNGEALISSQFDILRRALVAAKPKNKDPMVVITADRTTSFQLAVDAMDAARSAGLFRVTFPTAKREAE